jgi:hypothetical protein
VGASGWDYCVPYQPDVDAAFVQLQDQVLASGDFLWDEELYGAPPPRTREELAAVKEGAAFWEEGTHTVLDMDRVVPAYADGDDEDPDNVGAIRPMSAEEMREYLGTDRPTEQDFFDVYRQFGAIVDGISRWTGRYAILYDAGGEQQIVFFGVSGD